MSKLRVAAMGVYREGLGLAEVFRRVEAGLAACWRAKVLVAKPRESRGAGTAARKAGTEALMAAIFKRACCWITSEVWRTGASAVRTKGTETSSRPRTH